MALGHGPTVVTNGLILALDAADRNSYPATGTTWTDLSGNGNSGTLTNGPTYNSGNGGSLVFDGVNDVVNVSSSSLGLSSGTISFWIKSGTSKDIYNTHSGSWNQNTLWGEGGNLLLRISNGTPSPGDVAISSSLVFDNNFHFVCTQWTTGGERSIWLDGTKRASLTNTLQYIPSSTFEVGYKSWSASYYSGNMYNILSYNRALTAQEISQNYNALRGRFTPEYETLTYTVSGNLTVTGNGTNSVTIFKTSGGDGWNDQAYSLVSFTAPCTIEFNKNASSGDNGGSYAMIGWNADPTANASYSSIDHASYPYRTDQYQVYHNGSQVHASGTWSTANKFYIVYGTDGFIRHYNGSTLLYSVNYGTGNTVYVDSSLYSVNATFGGFSNIKVIRLAWNGTDYV